MADLDIDSDGSYDNDQRSEAGQSVSSSVRTVNRDYVGYVAGEGGRRVMCDTDEAI
jgi:hypothetical protein